MADAFADLLDLIVRDYAIPDAQKDIDLNASVDEPAAVIEADKQLIVTESTERARQLFPSFRTGLVLAFEAQGVGKHEIRLDDRDAEQNAIADALIAYLVRFDLAESRSEETEPGHYDYFISVNWDALYQLAAERGDRSSCRAGPGGDDSRWLMVTPERLNTDPAPAEGSSRRKSCLARWVRTTRRGWRGRSTSDFGTSVCCGPR